MIEEREGTPESYRTVAVITVCDNCAEAIRITPRDSRFPQALPWRATVNSRFFCSEWCEHAYEPGRLDHARKQALRDKLRTEVRYAEATA